MGSILGAFWALFWVPRDSKIEPKIDQKTKRPPRAAQEAPRAPKEAPRDPKMSKFDEKMVPKSEFFGFCDDLCVKN